MIIALIVVTSNKQSLGSIHPQWVSINNAVYVCYNCSGIHRGFGVQFSFIRSLSMDTISDNQRKLLSLGGNKRFAEFMEEYDLNSEPAKVKYKTKAAKFYRGMLKAMVEGTTYNEPIPSEKEGRQVIKSYMSSEPRTTGENFEQFGNTKSNIESIEKKKGSEGFFDKVINAAKDFGHMTKSAAGTVWEKGKSLTVNQHVNYK